MNVKHKDTNLKSSSEENKSKELKLASYLDWIKFLDLVDTVLKESGFQKVLTPFLVTSGALESQLEPFDLSLKFGTTTKLMQLPTSPEFHLKMALALGLKDIYEIKTCFRNHENSEHHSPEFTMLEFYKNDLDLEEFVKIVLGILDSVQMASNRSNLPKVQEFEISDLFKSLGFDLVPTTTLEEIKSFATSLEIYSSSEDNFDDIFFRIWLDKIEPSFDPDVLTLVKFYPPSQAALAKINSQGWAERFELYWQNLELGNAFNELKGSSALMLRWEQENLKRVRSGKSKHPIDENLINSNENLPNCCGIAIGLDRLYMAMNGYNDINDFKIFSNLK